MCGARASVCRVSVRVHARTLRACSATLFRHFVQYLCFLFQCWTDYVDEMISQNGKLEWDLAKAAGQVVLDADGNETDDMYTTVIGDAGWGKRSYKGHGMTSAAGVVSTEWAALASHRLPSKPNY